MDFLIKKDSFDQDMQLVLRTCDLVSSFPGKSICLYVGQVFSDSELY